ncbi:MAG TPA: hypothetical protein VEQ87_01245 [Burkholderiales bacterium]|nr:hypothetical protein [Burkholderiales bacterium]
MSAAANAAGFLYLQGKRPEAEPSADAAQTTAPSPAANDSRQPARTPTVSYRKRRAYALPSV